MIGQRGLLYLVLSVALSAPATARVFTSCGATMAYLAQTPPAQRLVVVSMGAVTPVGKTGPETWNGLQNGASGIGPIVLFPDADRLPVHIAGQVPNFTFGPAKNYGFLPKANTLSRTPQLAVTASVEAARRAGLLHGTGDEAWRDRVGVLIGSTQGDMQEAERGAVALNEALSQGASDPHMALPDPLTGLKGIAGLAASHVSIALQARGPSFCPSSACASGSHAIALAGAMVSTGLADIMIAGGADAPITPLGIAARHLLRVLSQRNDDPTRASRPWDKSRDGFVLGEAAATLVITTESYALRHGLAVIAYLAGTGMTSDAGSLTAPSPKGQARAMRLALQQAKLQPEHIGYVHAHGTSTIVGDVAEAEGLQMVFGNHVYQMRISSTKGATGHSLGASGAVGAVTAIAAMNDGVAPPTLNLSEPSLAAAKGARITAAELARLHLVPGVAEAIDVEAVAVNSFGLGGQNVVLIFVRPPYWPAPFDDR